MNLKNKDKNANLLFLIWPLLSVYTAIVNYRANWAKNAIWLFVIYFGFSMTILEFSDGERYRDRFLQLTTEDINVSNYFERVLSESPDFIEPFITYYLSRITGDYRILFAVFGLIFGYFYSRNIWLLINSSVGIIKQFSIVLIITLALIMPFWTIVGFRFNTAFHIFLFGLLNYYIHNKKSYLLFIIISPLLHFSFIIPSIILLIIEILGYKYYKIYFYLFLLSFFVEQLNVSILSDGASFLPEVFSKRVNDYTSEEYVESVGKYQSITRDDVNLYVVLYRRALSFTIIVLFSIVYFKSLDLIKKNKLLSKLFCFTLFFYSFSNFISSVPSAGRFFMISQVTAISFLLLFFQNNKEIYLKNLKHIKWASPLLIFFCIISFWEGLSYINFLTIVGNPILAIFIESNIAIADIIKGKF
jgi:hypothetical protein